MGRDRGRGKRGGSGGRGGGGKSYIANIEELQLREQRGQDDDDDDDDDDDEEEEEQAMGGGTAGGDTGAVTSVFTRRVQKVAKATGDDEEDGEEEDDAPKGLLTAAGGGAKNPNRAMKQEKMLKVSSLKVDDGELVDATAGMNRKEREAAEAQRKKEEYMRKHLAGETEQARKDLERLAMVRKKREEDAKKREATGRKPGMSAYGIDSDGGGSNSSDDEEGGASVAKAPAPLSDAAAKKKAAAAAVVADEGSTDESKLEKLNSIDIKKMNGDALKDHLKARGLDVQGNKKDLMQRLIDFEKTRS